MSLPPVVSWRYDWHPEPGSAEAKLYTDFLVARDWLARDSAMTGDDEHPRAAPRSGSIPRTSSRGRLLHVKRDTVRLPDGDRGDARVHRASGRGDDHAAAAGRQGCCSSGNSAYPHQRAYSSSFPPARSIPARIRCRDRASASCSEETGYTAARWAHIVATMHPLITYSTERIAIYAADALDLRQARYRLDAGEFVEIITAHARRMRWRGSIAARAHRRQDDARRLLPQAPGSAALKRACAGRCHYAAPAHSRARAGRRLPLRLRR